MNTNFVASSKENRKVSKSFDSMEKALDFYLSQSGYSLIKLDSFGAFVGFWKDGRKEYAVPDFTINIRKA